MFEALSERLGRESCICIRMALEAAIREADQRAERWDQRDSWDAAEQAAYWRKQASMNRRALERFRRAEYPNLPDWAL